MIPVLVTLVRTRENDELSNSVSVWGQNTGEGKRNVKATFQIRTGPPYATSMWDIDAVVLLVISRGQAAASLIIREVPSDSFLS